MAASNLFPLPFGNRFVAEARAGHRPSLLSRFRRFAGGLLRRADRPGPLLDLDTMPDHLKRDLGFLDGRR